MKFLNDRTQNSSGSNDLARRQTLSPSIASRTVAKYPTTGSFIMTFHPDKAEHFASYPDRCMFGSSPTLIDLRLAYEGKADIQWLIVQLSTFQEKVNVQQKMTSYQIETCAQSISQEFGFLKATEIMLFLARLQGGAYTVDWYGSITPDKIVLALREQFMPWRNHQFYLMEKAEEDRRREEAVNNPSAVSWDEFVAMMKEKGEKINNVTNPLDYDTDK